MHEMSSLIFPWWGVLVWGKLYQLQSERLLPALTHRLAAGVSARPRRWRRWKWMAGSRRENGVASALKRRRWRRGRQTHGHKWRSGNKSASYAVWRWRCCVCVGELRSECDDVKKGNWKMQLKFYAASENLEVIEGLKLRLLFWNDMENFGFTY